MKYYTKLPTGGFELVADQARIDAWSSSKLHGKDNHLIPILELDELKKVANEIFSDIKTSRTETRIQLIDEINKADSIQHIYDIMLNTYKKIIPNHKNKKYEMYSGDGILAKSIRFIFSKYLHIQLGSKLNQVGEISVTAKVPGIRTILFNI